MMMKTALIVGIALLGLDAGAARAVHQGDIPVLKRLAHELEDRARHVHHYAESQAHHFTWQEQQMLRALHHFESQARQFHNTVEGYFSSPWQVQQALQHLNNDADHVEMYIYHSHAMAHVVQDWNRAARLLGRINGYFWNDDGHGGGHDGDHGGGHGGGWWPHAASNSPSLARRVASFQALFDPKR